MKFSPCFRSLFSRQKPSALLLMPSQTPSRAIAIAIATPQRHHQQRQLTTPTRTTLQQPRRPSGISSTPKPNPKTVTATRPFLSSLLSNNNNNNSNARTLTATRTLPYPPEPLFKVISSVESYSQFLPFLSESTVTARDTETGYPTRAFLTVGYGPLRETFTSRVDCDKSKWVVEARSGARFASSDAGAAGTGGAPAVGFPGANEGIFEHLSTKWELVPLSTGQTKVQLEIRFEFRSALHAAMMGAVEGQMAGVMIEAFEKRIREVEGGR